MMLMIIAVLAVVGLALGSFVNALVWRVRQQEIELEKKKPNKKRLSELSIGLGRSMCVHCGHQLAAKDLVPLLSWLSLRGKCRYCQKAISPQYPIIEVATALLFVASYIWWPKELSDAQVILFILWLPILTGLMALLVYDLKWLILPDRIMFPLALFAGTYALVGVLASDRTFTGLLNVSLAVAIGGGLFYLLFQVSAGKWIGGGDVKLGWLLGLIVGTAGKSVLFIFLAALLGTVISVPMLANGRLQKNSVIPFGPFLIMGGIITVLWGSAILQWYQHLFFPYL
jgi:prepilin signal peptidase PulO-like enzyme (type II secretory pathway)